MSFSRGGLSPLGHPFAPHAAMVHRVRRFFLAAVASSQAHAYLPLLLLPAPASEVDSDLLSTG